MPVITKQLMREARTARGGYTGAQTDLARIITGKRKKIMKSMVGQVIDEYTWQKFVSAGKKGKQPVKQTPKMDPQEKARRKLERKKKRAESKRFYLNRAWRDLRVRVLEKYQCKCMMCGRSPRDHGIVVHVDHIKPKSTHPELALEISNLQLLCEDCNIGKSNKYGTDWRPDAEDYQEPAIEEEHAAHMMAILSEAD